MNTVYEIVDGPDGYVIRLVPHLSESATDESSVKFVCLRVVPDLLQFFAECKFQGICHLI